MDEVGSLDIRPLSAELLEAARKIGEDPKRREEDVRAIREWLAQQPHIEANPPDQFVVNFLRACRFDLDKTKHILDMHYTIKTLVPELFKNRDLRDPALREVLELGMCVVLWDCDSEGWLVHLGRFGLDTPKGKFKPEDVLKMNFIISEYLMMTYDAMVINGMNGIIDLSAMSFGHMTQMNLGVMKRMGVCMEQAYPRMQIRMHFVRSPRLMVWSFKLWHTFIRDKSSLKSFAYRDNFEALYEKVPRRLFPNEYGGEAGPINDLARDFAQKVFEFNDYFIADEANVVIEERRVGKKITFESLFGIASFFKKPTID